jgi:hypothetical protein
VARVLAPALIAAAAALTAAPLWSADLDDALIVYRYARHLARGLGWQYNVGETFNGVTCPLYTLLLAALGAVHGDIRFWAHAVSAGATVATGCLVRALLVSAGAPAAGLVAGLLATVNPLLAATIGLETPLYLALVALAVWCAERRCGWVTGLVLGLATLTRGDAVLLAGLLWTRAVLRDRRLPAGELLAFGLTLAPWVAYSAVAFGEILPHTLGAKRGQGASGLWGPGWLVLTQGPGIVLAFTRTWWVLGPLLGLGLAGLWRLRWPASALVLHGLAVTLAYTALNVPAYHWYFAPLVLGLCVAAGAGAARALAWLPAGPPRGLAGGALAVLVLGQVAIAHVCCGAHHAYRDIGLWLRATTPPAASVAAMEIGHLGWYSERPIVDMVGLVTPRVAERLAAGDAGWWLPAHRPDYVVVHDPPWAVEAAGMATAAFREYDLVERRAYPGYGAYRIWRRRGAG